MRDRAKTKSEQKSTYQILTLEAASDLLSSCVKLKKHLDELHILEGQFDAIEAGKETWTEKSEDRARTRLATVRNFIISEEDGETHVSRITILAPNLESDAHGLYAATIKYDGTSDHDYREAKLNFANSVRKQIGVPSSKLIGRSEAF